jgi:hypothetical protein
VRIIFFILLFAAYASLGAQEVTEKDDNRDGQTDQWVEFRADGGKKVRLDTDYDGAVDYIIYYTASGRKEREEFDFNADGEMDDFYFYLNGVLTGREIDTNYDGIVDMWVRISEGVYIAGWKRDSDYDGKIDIDRNYESDDIAQE